MVGYKLRISHISFSFYAAFAVFAFSFIIACANTQSLVGKWREIGKTASLELYEDGKFKAVDNHKLAVTGKYFQGEHGNIIFEINRQGSTTEIVTGKFYLENEILTLISEDGKESQKYRRQN